MLNYLRLLLTMIKGFFRASSNAGVINPMIADKTKDVREVAWFAEANDLRDIYWGEPPVITSSDFSASEKERLIPTSHPLYDKNFIYADDVDEIKKDPNYTAPYKDAPKSTTYIIGEDNKD